MALSRPCRLAASVLLLAGATEGASLISVQRHNAENVPSSHLGDSDLLVANRFAAFVQEHGRTYTPGSEEYTRRLALFQDRLSAIHQQNSKTGRQWTAGVNSLADRTTEELARLRGYRHGVRSEGGAASGGGVGLVSTAVHSVDMSKLPKDFTWQPHLQAMKDVKDQGACGSCWAVASATVLRAHAELYQKDRTFSIQQIISCAPNPRKCGGSGGCGGATAELAMDYIAKVGAVSEDELVYGASDSKCPSKLVEEPPRSLKSALRAAVALPEVAVRGGGGAKFGMVGWKKLPENKLEPLMLALYERGPVAVSVGAGDVWNMYASGIMSPCSKEAVINHAVALTGFGEEGDKKYWQIQNSWGPGWGESGFARLERLDHRDESGYCGWDTQPDQGTGCQGGPKKVWVCGSCGILYDSVVPTFELGDEGWWKRHGLRNSTV